jgi:hypothetical protein
MMTMNMITAFKVVVLIMASDHSQHYKGLQLGWKAYMHTYPSEIRAYFVKANPELKGSYLFDGDTIYTQGNERGHEGLSIKTMRAIEALTEIEPYEYLIRTVLYSFYDLKALLKFVDRLPKLNVYCGSKAVWHNSTSNIEIPTTYVSSAGIILSKDVVDIIHQGLLNAPLDTVRSVPTDALLGTILSGRVDILAAPRVDLYDIGEFQDVYKASVDGVTFHWTFRGSSSNHKQILQMNNLMIAHVYEIHDATDRYERVPMSLIVPSVYANSNACGRAMLESVRRCPIIPSEVIIAISGYDKEPGPSNTENEELWILSQSDDYKHLNIRIFYRNGVHKADSNRNFAAEQATFHYVTAFDIDDLVHPLRFYVLYRAFQLYPDLEVLLTNYEMFSNTLPTVITTNRYDPIPDQDIKLYYSYEQLRSGGRKCMDAAQYWFCEHGGLVMLAHNGWGTMKRSTWLQTPQRDIPGAEDSMHQNDLVSAGRNVSLLELKLGYYRNSAGHRCDLPF